MRETTNTEDRQDYEEVNIYPVLKGALAGQQLAQLLNPFSGVDQDQSKTTRKKEIAARTFLLENKLQLEIYHKSLLRIINTKMKAKDFKPELLSQLADDYFLLTKLLHYINRHIFFQRAAAVKYGIDATFWQHDYAAFLDDLKMYFSVTASFRQAFLSFNFNRLYILREKQLDTGFLHFHDTSHYEQFCQSFQPLINNVYHHLAFDTYAPRLITNTVMQLKHAFGWGVSAEEGSLSRKARAAAYWKEHWFQFWNDGVWLGVGVITFPSVYPHLHFGFPSALVTVALYTFDVVNMTVKYFLDRARYKRELRRLQNAIDAENNHKKIEYLNLQKEAMLAEWQAVESRLWTSWMVTFGLWGAKLMGIPLIYIHQVSLLTVYLGLSGVVILIATALAMQLKSFYFQYKDCCNEIERLNKLANSDEKEIQQQKFLKKVIIAKAVIVSLLAAGASAATLSLPFVLSVSLKALSFAVGLTGVISVLAVCFVFMMRKNFQEYKAICKEDSAYISELNNLKLLSDGGANSNQPRLKELCTLRAVCLEKKLWVKAKTVLFVAAMVLAMPIVFANPAITMFFVAIAVIAAIYLIGYFLNKRWRKKTKEIPNQLSDFKKQVKKAKETVAASFPANNSNLPQRSKITYIEDPVAATTGSGEDEMQRDASGEIKAVKAVATNDDPSTQRRVAPVSRKKASQVKGDTGALSHKVISNDANTERKVKVSVKQEVLAALIGRQDDEKPADLSQTANSGVGADACDKDIQSIAACSSTVFAKPTYSNDATNTISGIIAKHAGSISCAASDRNGAANDSVEPISAIFAKGATTLFIPQNVTPGTSSTAAPQCRSRANSVPDLRV